MSHPTTPLIAAATTIAAAGIASTAQPSLSAPALPLMPRRPHSKARSVSSLPPPMRISSTSSSPILPTSRLARSPPLLRSSDSPMRQQRHRSPTLPSSSSPRVRSRPFQSPSKLPSTDCMSYFPPFESMGSAVDGMDDAEDDGPVAGPSRSPSQDRDSSSSSSGSSRSSSRHGKGRSLGSLAGLMAWATFTPSPASTPANEATPLSQPPVAHPAGPLRMTRSPSDGEAVQALARRCSQTKRRVLEPMQSNEHFGDSLEQGERVRRRTGTASPEKAHKPVPELNLGKLQKRRNGSEMEVEKLMKLTHRTQSSGGKGHSRSQTLGEEDAAAVERLIGFNNVRPQRPHLSLPPSALPSWRFPLPSPPVISLSPDIPIELFQLEISNPASTTSSPSKMHFARPELTLSSLPSLRAKLASAGDCSASMTMTDHNDDENDTQQDIDEIDDALSPTATASCSWSSCTESESGADSRPTTPDKRDVRVYGAVSHHAHPAQEAPPPFEQHWSRSPRDQYLLDVGDKLKLRRTESRGSAKSGRSCDSKETVKPRQGEVTPKAGKGWRAVEMAGGM